MAKRTCQHCGKTGDFLDMNWFNGDISGQYFLCDDCYEKSWQCNECMESFFDDRPIVIENSADYVMSATVRLCPSCVKKKIARNKEYVQSLETALAEYEKEQ